LSRLPEAKKRK